MKPQQVTQDAFRAARRFLAKAPGFCNLNGYCIEASVLMHKYLKKRGVGVRLVRYKTAVGGHWTIRTPEGEFDPTIGCWPNAPRLARGAKCDTLYPVTDQSPHRRWKQTPVSETTAYSTVWTKDFDRKNGT